MPPDKNILIDVWLVSLLTNRFVAEILEGSGLSVDEFAMYGLISDLAPITSADLVRATGLPPTTVSSLVRRCEARGELVRIDNAEDARSSLLELTPKGYRVLGSAVPQLLEGIESIKLALGGNHDRVREELGEFDRAIRGQLGIGPRPYELRTNSKSNAGLSYAGESLTPKQADETRKFIDWIRSRDG